MAQTKIRGNTQIKDGTIENAQIAAAAGIATSKLADGSKFIQSDGSVAMAAALDMGTNLINNVTDPVSAQDAATKNYVDTNGGASTLGGLNDVTITTPADNELLAYNNGTGEWINQTKSEAGFGSLASQDTINNDDWSGTDLAIANGGTGASTASGARTALGVAIGSDVQAWDDDLDDIAGLTHSDGDFLVSDGTNWTLESGATARTSLGVTAFATRTWVKEEFAGDGTTTTFSLTDAPVDVDHVLVFLNGIVQNDGGTEDFTLGGTPTDDIIFNTAPASGDPILVWYMY